MLVPKWEGKRKRQLSPHLISSHLISQLVRVREMELPIPPLLDSSSDAPTYRLNHQTLSQFSTLSYPSPISTSQSSLRAALSTLPSLPSLSKQLAQPSNQQPAIELNLSINNPYHHKVQASLQHSNNLIVRVTKRRRKVPLRNEKGEIVQEGQYRIEPVGIENKLIRFRGTSLSLPLSHLPPQSDSCSVPSRYSYGRFPIHPFITSTRPSLEPSRRNSFSR